MSLEGFAPIIVKIYGGLCDFIDRAALPVGLSPRAENVTFGPNTVRTRDGFASYLTDVSAPMALTDYVKPNGERHLLILQADGTLKDEQPEGVVKTADSAIGLNCRMNGVTQYGRKWLAFEDGAEPATYAVQYNGSVIRRITTEPPNNGPTLDEPAAGTVPRGRRFAFTVFENEYNYITGASPIGAITKAGDVLNLRATLQVGPPGTTKRRLFVSPANNPKDFYTLPNVAGFTVNDNDPATATTSVNFTDAQLIGGDFPGNQYLEIEPLPPSFGVTTYKDRLVAWGTLSRKFRALYIDVPDPLTPAGWTPYIIGARDLSFDGGPACAAMDPANPATWLHGAFTVATLGARFVDAVPGSTGVCYQLTGNAADTGLIYQAFYNNITGFTTYFEQGHKYAIRGHAMKVGAGVRGTLRVEFHSPLMALPIVPPLPYPVTDLVCRLDIPVSSLSSTQWGLFTSPAGTAVTANQMKAQQGWWSVEVISSGGGPTENGTNVRLDWIEIFDVDDTSASSTLWVSDPADFETFNPKYSLVYVSDGDGQRIRQCFVLRDALYVVKERSLWVTTDNADDPTNWPVDLVDDTVGTKSAHGVTTAPGLALITAPTGIFLFDGGKPIYVSQEIEGTYRDISWERGDAAWAVVESSKQRAYFGLPSGGGGMSKNMVLDFVEGWDSPMPSGSGRKWATNIIGGANAAQKLFTCATLAARDNGNVSVLFGKSDTAASNLTINSTDFTFAPAVGAQWTASGAGTLTTFAGPANPFTSAPNNTGEWRCNGVGDATAGSGGTVAVPAGSYGIVSIWLKGVSGYAADVTVVARIAGCTPASATFSSTAGAPREWQRIVVVTQNTTAASIANVLIEITLQANNRVYLYGTQVQMNAYGADYGWVPTTAGQVVGATAGTVAIQQAQRYYDYNGPIEAIYDTAPLGDDVGRCVFDRSVYRISGEGTFEPSLLAPDGTVAKVLAPTALVANAINDIELGANVQHVTAGVRASSLVRGTHWILKRLSLFFKNAAYGSLRGKN